MPAVMIPANATHRKPVSHCSACHALPRQTGRGGNNAAMNLSPWRSEVAPGPARRRATRRRWMSTRLDAARVAEITAAHPVGTLQHRGAAEEWPDWRYTGCCRAPERLSNKVSDPRQNGNGSTQAGIRLKPSCQRRTSAKSSSGITASASGNMEATAKSATVRL